MIDVPCDIYTTTAGRRKKNKKKKISHFLEQFQEEIKEKLCLRQCSFEFLIQNSIFLIFYLSSYGDQPPYIFVSILRNIQGQRTRESIPGETHINKTLQTIKREMILYAKSLCRRTQMSCPSFSVHKNKSQIKKAAQQTRLDLTYLTGGDVIRMQL